MRLFTFFGVLLFLSIESTSAQEIPTELLTMATDYLCYLPQHAFALLGAVDMSELTQLQEVLTAELMPTLEYGNYTDINVTALFLRIKDMAPNSYVGIMNWLVPYKTRFQHLSTNSKRFLANTKKRLMGLEGQQEELTTDYTLVKQNINNVLNSWKALPQSDQECLASFIGTMHDAIMSPEFDDFINAAAAANSQEELEWVLYDFAAVVQNHTSNNYFFKMKNSPRYIRKRSSDDSSNSNPDDRYPKYPEPNYQAKNEQNLNVTGLREKKLLTLIIWLVILSILALIILIINILLLVVLQMNHHGMRALKIYNFEDSTTGQEESMVHFTAQKSHFDHVTVSNGAVFGPKNQNFVLEASRIIIGQPTENSTKFMLQEGICRFQNTDEFLVLSSANAKTLFSAQHPLVSVDHKIKQLSSSLIITNKVRSAVTEDLDISAENLVIRGNEGIQVETKTFNISAQTILALNTSTDGSLYFSARHIYLGNQRKTLMMSSSPALSASVEAFRLCICKSTPTRAKLFLVNGNRPCIAPASICK